MTYYAWPIPLAEAASSWELTFSPVVQKGCCAIIRKSLVLMGPKWSSWVVRGLQVPDQSVDVGIIDSVFTAWNSPTS
jgi:hypothetical protein